MFKEVIVLFTVLFGIAYGYSAGAPESVCDDLTPKHPVAPQSSKFPYTVSVDKKQVKAGETVAITISGGKFKGFIVQVRKDGKSSVGSFLTADTDKFVKTINCHGGKANAVTHKNSTDKKDLVLKWVAPNTPGEYQVFSTVAEDGGTFWVKQAGAKITVN